jgi:hypothetical protein
MVICTIGAAMLAVMVAAQGASAQDDPDTGPGWYQRCTSVYPKDSNGIESRPFDPIVHPNEAPPVGHQHLFVGGTAINNFYTNAQPPNNGPFPLYNAEGTLNPDVSSPDVNKKFYRYSTTQELQAGGSSCAFQQDSSAAPSPAAKVFTDGVIGGNYSSYWVPDLKVRNGTWASVIQVNAYYKKGASSVDPQKVERFPSGLKMVIRDDGTSKTRVQWYCSGLTTGKNNIFRDRPYDCAPNSDAKYVTTHIRFPQCGAVNPEDGSVNGDLVYAGSGGCPKDHPHVFPRLSLAVKYDTSLGANSQLAIGQGEDPAHADPGTGFHADYFEAWKPNAALQNGGTADALQYFIDHCIKAGIDCRDGDRLP